MKLFAIVQKTRTCSIETIFNIVLRQVYTKYKRQFCINPFREIAGFSDCIINKRVSFCCDFSNEHSLDKEVMKVAHRSRITIPAAATPVIINIVVGQFIGNIFARSYHFFTNRIMNRIPVIVRDMVSIAVVFNSLAILRRLVVANTLRNPLPVFGATCIVTEFYYCFVVEYLILSSKHLCHAVFIFAQRNVANMRIGIIWICRIKWKGFISFFEIYVARGRNFVVDNSGTRVKVAVFAFIITDAENNRFILL